MIVFDIETGPRPLEEIRRQMPEFVPPPHPGEFDPASVKLGNLKDKDKIEAKIEEAREKHAKAVAEYDGVVEDASLVHISAFLSKAALSATTGRALAIGLMDEDSIEVIGDGRTEEGTINHFWRIVERSQQSLVGHYSHSFDLPFLIRRSWMLGIDVPVGLAPDRYGRFSSRFVDLVEVWRLGNRGEHIKLQDLAASFGFKGKHEGLDGGQFAELWNTDRDKAIEYLKSDLAVTYRCAERMGVV